MNNAKKMRRRPLQRIDSAWTECGSPCTATQDPRLNIAGLGENGQRISENCDSLNLDDFFTYWGTIAKHVQLWSNQFFRGNYVGQN